jgi:hypothetical protein
MSCWPVEKHCDLGLLSLIQLAQKPLCQEICSSVANKYALLFRNGMSKRIISLHKTLNISSSIFNILPSNFGIK